MQDRKINYTKNHLIVQEVSNKMSKTEKKKYMTLFMIIVFSILLAMTTGITTLLTRFLYQVILFIAQLVVVKVLLDDFYSE